MPSTDPFTSSVEPQEFEKDFFRGVHVRAARSVYTDGETKSLNRRPPRFPDELRITTIACKLADFEKNSAHIMAPPETETSLDDAFFPRKKLLAQIDHGEEDAKNLHIKIRDAVHKVLNDKPKGFYQYLMLPELTASFYTQERKWLIDELEKLAVEHGTYIVPGTYHCHEDMVNVAEVLTPYEGVKSKVYKMTPATVPGESIRTPDVRKLRLMITDHLRLAVCICLDLYDPGIVLKLVSKSLERVRGDAQRISREKVDLLLVPSYSGDNWKYIKEAARTVSQAMGSIVTVVNTFGSKTPNSCCFVCGQPMRAKRESITVENVDFQVHHYLIKKERYEELRSTHPQFSSDFLAFFGGPRVKNLPE